MFRKLFAQVLLHLGELEDEFRRYHLRDDTATFIITALLFTCANATMLHVDYLFYHGDAKLFFLMVIFRGLHVVVTVTFLLAAYNTKQIKKFDVYTFVWLLFNGIYLLLFNFTRPSTYLFSTFDILFVFGLYLLSPLPLKQTIALAVNFTVGALLVAVYYKTGLSKINLSTTIGSHVFVHMLGLASALQVQSFRRWSFQAYAKEKKASELAHNLLHIDALTESLSRRRFFELAGQEFEQSKNNGISLSVLVIDLDYFKKINDAYGHGAGDHILKTFSKFILTEKRAQDIFGRLGGEEFGMILPNADIKSAAHVAKRIQALWAEKQIRHGANTIQSTISIGITSRSETDGCFEELLNRADTLMYKAKRRGRNRVAIK